MTDGAELLRVSLAVAVPLWIEEMRSWPEELRLKTARDAAQVVAKKGDIIQFRSKKKGETAAAFNELAKGLAAASFVPDGVKFLGLHFDASARR